MTAVLTCADCRFWAKGSAGMVGECRRNAPQAFNPSFDPDAGNGDRLTIWARWPAVRDTDWCGEFVPS